MFYYEVACGGNSRGAMGIFTYAHSTDLTIGQHVQVLLQNKYAFGFIVKKSAEPSFRTTEIVNILSETLTSEAVATFLELRKLYPLADTALANLFLPPEHSKRSMKVTQSSEPEPLPKLNPEQANILSLINKSSGNVLLHGDTGSGKTRIYTHLAGAELHAGRSVFILAPEIGLATFLYKDIVRYFPSAVLYHSKLTKVERSHAWEVIQNSTDPVVVVGPRSALSLPVKNIGLIVIDESHDQSYRQENAPHVNAKTLASLLAREHTAQVVYGTATPLVADVRQAESLGMPILRLTKQAVDTGKTSSVRVVGYEVPGERTGGSLLKSSKSVIADAISKGGQSLVLINRRGTARYVSCASCGHESRCTTCDRLLTYHHDTYELRCHHCDKRFPVPSICTMCGRADISMRSFGSKAVVDELVKTFPDASIKRFDTDTSKKDHLLASVNELKGGDVQIIVGTQMIAKGLDLPELKSLVVLAGGSTTGYMSEEREFQLLYQVLGRALRGHQNTEVVVQASNPDSKVLNWAVTRDYESFMKSELADRKSFNYPPFCYLMLIHVRRKTSKGAQKAAGELSTKLRASYKGIQISGATPNTNERIGPYYHWHILLKSPKRGTLVRIAESIGTGVSCELDPVDIP
jgi:primosomal protein N' (replication factor Y) (superfamily II helicase)